MNEREEKSLSVTGIVSGGQYMHLLNAREAGIMHVVRCAFSVSSVAKPVPKEKTTWKKRLQASVVVLSPRHHVNMILIKCQELNRRPKDEHSTLTFFFGRNQTTMDSASLSFE